MLVAMSTHLLRWLRSGSLGRHVGDGRTKGSRVRARISLHLRPPAELARAARGGLRSRRRNLLHGLLRDGPGQLAVRGGGGLLLGGRAALAARLVAEAVVDLQQHSLLL